PENSLPSYSTPSAKRDTTSVEFAQHLRRLLAESVVAVDRDLAEQLAGAVTVAKVEVGAGEFQPLATRHLGIGHRGFRCRRRRHVQLRRASVPGGRRGGRGGCNRCRYDRSRGRDCSSLLGGRG